MEGGHYYMTDDRAKALLKDGLKLMGQKYT